MSTHAILTIVLYVGVLLLLAYPLGGFINNVMSGQAIASKKPFRSIEGFIYKVCGIDPDVEMSWLSYAIGLITFNILGVLFVFGLQLFQSVLPLNPQGLASISPDSSFNTAISFATNTNWQAYVGEGTMSYLTQMLGLTTQNFLSAASGIVVVIALIRSFARNSIKTIGNLWVDLTRITLYVLVPIAVVYAIFLVGQGSIQNFDAYKDVKTVEVTKFDAPRLDADGQPLKDEKGVVLTEPASTDQQTLPMGPVASQEAIKMLGTNGGGFFNANSAHPYENPTPLSNFIQILSIFLIPAALCFTFGRMVEDKRQGWVVLVTMLLIFLTVTFTAVHFESQANPVITSLGVDGAMGNMEGKETRFGIDDSSIFASITTLASCGAVNSMHDSFMPMGGFVPLWNMMLGEVVFGGVGTGLYGMLVFAILAVFIAGLMIGRTPEYLGKKIESYEMKMVAIAILVTPILVLVGTAIAVMSADGVAGIANPGAHGFSEILYAFTSAANNNGSAFAGLSANTPFYNSLLAIAMWFGRFGVIVPVLALAGAFAAKKKIAVNEGTMPTHGPLFIVLLAGTVILVGALNYVPALALGPIVEQLMLPVIH